MKKNNVSLLGIKAIIGLGNPGDRYYKTRHSIGYRIVDTLVTQCGEQWHDRGTLQVADIMVHDRPIIIVKSNSFMNDSGKVVPYLLKKGIKPEEMLVVHDELEKPFSTMSVKVGGSHRGHNGLRSIIGVCGDNFYRLRIGIGRPADKVEVPHYVLASFDQIEVDVQQVIADAVEFLLSNL